MAQQCLVRQRQTSGPVPGLSQLGQQNLAPVVQQKAPAKHIEQPNPRKAQPCRDNGSITRRIKATNKWEQAFATFVQFSHEFNGINTSALVFHMAKLVDQQRRTGGPLSDSESQELRAVIRELHDFAEEELPSMGPRELCNTTHGLSKMGMLSRRFVQLLVARTDPFKLKNEELSSLLWALAHAGQRPADARWMRAMADQVLERRSALRHKELASCMWALAKLKCNPGPAALNTLVEEVERRAHAMLPIDFANILWSLAVQQYKPAAAANLHTPGSASPPANPPIAHTFSHASLHAASSRHHLEPITSSAVQHLCTHNTADTHNTAFSTAATLQSHTIPVIDLTLTTPPTSHASLNAHNIAPAYPIRNSTSPSTAAAHTSPSATTSIQGPNLLPVLEWAARRVHDTSPHNSSIMLWAAAAGGWALPEGWVQCMRQAFGGIPVPMQGADSLIHETVGGLQTQQQQQQIEQPQIGVHGRHISMATTRNSSSGSGSRSSNTSASGGWRWELQWQLRPAVSSRDASLALQAMAKLQHNPGSEVLDAFMTVVLAAAWQERPQDLISCLWGASKLGYQLSGEQLRLVYRASKHRLSEYTPEQVACLVGSLARQKARPPQAWITPIVWHVLYWQDLWGSRELSHTMWGLARMHCQLSGRVVSLMLRALLHKAQPHHNTNCNSSTSHTGTDATVSSPAQPQSTTSTNSTDTIHSAQPAACSEPSRTNTHGISNAPETTRDANTDSINACTATMNGVGLPTAYRLTPGGRHWQAVDTEDVHVCHASDSSVPYTATHALPNTATTTAGSGRGRGSSPDSSNVSRSDGGDIHAVGSSSTGVLEDGNNSSGSSSGSMVVEHVHGSSSSSSSSSGSSTGVVPSTYRLTPGGSRWAASTQEDIPTPYAEPGPLWAAQRAATHARFTAQQGRNRSATNLSPNPSRHMAAQGRESRSSHPDQMGAGFHRRAAPRGSMEAHQRMGTVNVNAVSHASNTMGGSQRPMVMPLSPGASSGLRHQHLANAIVAIPWLLPTRSRQEFGQRNRSLLQEVERAALSLLSSPSSRLAHPAHSSVAESNTFADLTEPGVARAATDARQWHSPNGRQAAEGLGRRPAAPASGEPSGWAVCELLQLAQGFAAVQHWPGSGWLQAHQEQVALSWSLLNPEQQRRIVHCYVVLSDEDPASAVSRLMSHVTPEQAVNVHRLSLASQQHIQQAGGAGGGEEQSVPAQVQHVAAEREPVDQAQQATSNSHVAFTCSTHCTDDASGSSASISIDMGLGGSAPTEGKAVRSVVQTVGRGSEGSGDCGHGTARGEALHMLEMSSIVPLLRSKPGRAVKPQATASR